MFQLLKIILLFGLGGIYGLFIGSGLRAQGTSSDRLIDGPVLVLTPRVQSYEIKNQGRNAILWKVNRSPNISLNGPDNRSSVTLGLVGKGTDTLIAELTSADFPFEKRYDTLFIRKNDCPALVGRWVDARPRVCIGEVAVLSLDSLSGDSVQWQYSENPRFLWVRERTVRFPRSSVYFTPALTSSRFYRAIVMSGNCRDTSAVIFVRADLRPAGSFAIRFGKKFCAGAVTPSLSAGLSLGTGRWETDGKGSFSDPLNINAVYRSSVTDSGKVTLTWTVRNAGCPPARYSDTLTFIAPGWGGLKDSRPLNLCPGVPSVPLGAILKRGKGRWQAEPAGVFLNPADPNTVFIPLVNSRNRTVRLMWKAENGGCDSVYALEANIADAMTASIIEPIKVNKYCPEVPFRLRADTTGRRGNFRWFGSENILSGRETAEATASVSGKDSAVFYLSFEDFKTGCRTSDTVTVYFQTDKPTFFGKNDTVCAEEPVSLHAFGYDPDRPLIWEPANLLNDNRSPNPVFIPPVSDTVYVFKLKGTAKNTGCPAETELRISVKKGENLRFADPNGRIPDKFCSEYPNFIRVAEVRRCDAVGWFSRDKTTVRASGPALPSNPFYLSSDTVLSIRTLPPQNERYRFCLACYRAETGCTTMKDFDFQVLPVPRPGFTHEKTLPYSRRNVAFRNMTQGGINYSWDFGDPQSGTENNSQIDNPTHFFSTAGKFVITLVADNNACSKSFSDTIRVLEEEYYFPNAFTPDGDGKNDVFRPIPAFFQVGAPQSEELIKNAKVTSFEIFNVSGKVIYQLFSSDEWSAAPGWRGTYRDGSPAEIGTYLYKITIVQEPRGEVTHTGFVTLIR